MPKRPYPFVEVEWYDAHHTSEELDTSRDTWYPSIQVTRGWLVRDEQWENFITLANEYDKENPHLVRGIDSIPRGMIKQIHYIPKPRRKKA